MEPKDIRFQILKRLFWRSSFFERRQIHTVYPWSTLVRLDLLVCPPDLPPRNFKRFH